MDHNPTTMDELVAEQLGREHDPNDWTLLCRSDHWRALAIPVGHGTFVRFEELVGKATLGEEQWTEAFQLVMRRHPQTGFYEIADDHFKPISNGGALTMVLRASLVLSKREK